MKGAIEEYGGVILQFIIGLALLGLVMSFIDTNSDMSLGRFFTGDAEKSRYAGDFSAYNEKIPVLQTATGMYITEGSAVNLLSDEYILTATSASGQDLKENVQVANIKNVETGKYIDNLSTAQPGLYDVSYVLILAGRDKQGARAKSKTRVIVEPRPEEDNEESSEEEENK